MSAWQDLLGELYDHLEERELRMGLLRELDRQILERSTDAENFVETTLGTLLPRTDARSGYLLVRDEGAYTLKRAFTRESTAVNSTPGPLPVAIPFGDVLRRSEYPELFSWMPGDARSLLAFPIDVDNRPWGAFLLETPRPTLTAQAKNFTEAVLQQISIGLRDLITRDRLERFQRLHSAFFSVDLDEQRCLTILIADVYNLLPDRSKPVLLQVLFRRSSTNPYEREAPVQTNEELVIHWSSSPQERWAVVPMESFSGQALLRGALYLKGDPHDSEFATVYKAFSNFDTRTELAILLRKDPDSPPIGVINIESPMPNAFTPTEIHNLVDLLTVASPVLAAVRRRVRMARAKREASLYAVTKYLRYLEGLYDHKSASRRFTIRGNLYSALQMARTQGPSDLVARLETIQGEFEWIENSILELWEELSSVGRIESIRLMDLLQEIASEDKEDLGLYLEIDANISLLPAVRASRLLKEHLRNLLKNAVPSLKEKEQGSPSTYKPSVSVTGSVVTVTQTKSPAAIGVDVVAELNRRARLEIRDNGIGVTKEDRQKMFHPGFSTRGTAGFGLPAAQDYMREMGGDLDAESTHGEFFKVWLELPFSDADMPDTTAGDAEGA